MSVASVAAALGAFALAVCWLRAGGCGMTGVRQLTVGAEEADQRLDRWLRRLHPQVSQARIERMCRKGEIRVDGGRVKPATRLEAGQMVRLPPIADDAPARRAAAEAVSDADAAMIRACVI